MILVNNVTYTWGSHAIWRPTSCSLFSQRSVMANSRCEIRDVDDEEEKDDDDDEEEEKGKAAA